MARVFQTPKTLFLKSHAAVGRTWRTTQSQWTKASHNQQRIINCINALPTNSLQKHNLVAITPSLTLPTLLFVYPFISIAQDSHRNISKSLSKGSRSRRNRLLSHLAIRRGAQSSHRSIGKSLRKGSCSRRSRCLSRLHDIDNSLALRFSVYILAGGA